MRADIAQPSAEGAVAGWVFTAPKYTAISNFTLWRSVHTAGTGGWYHDFVVCLGRREDRSTTITTRSSARVWPRARAAASGRQRPFEPANRSLALRPPGPAAHPRGGVRHDRTAWLRADVRPRRVRDLLGADRARPISIRPCSRGRRTGRLLATADATGGQEDASRFAATDRGGGIEKVGIVVDGTCRAQRSSTPRTSLSAPVQRAEFRARQPTRPPSSSTPRSCRTARTRSRPR